MAHIYKRRKQFWICYYVHGRRVQKSLHTDNERIAKDKKLKIEYQLSIGELHLASRLPLPATLEDFCRYLKTTRTHKSYKNDISRLRVEKPKSSSCLDRSPKTSILRSSK